LLVGSKGRLGVVIGIHDGLLEVTVFAAGKLRGARTGAPPVFEV
jgi:hypothetical protein